MNLAKESFYTFIFQILGFIFATIAGMIIARALGPENKGILTVAMLCPYIFFISFNPAIEAAIIYNMGKKDHDIKAFAGDALVLSFALSLVALIAFFITLTQFSGSIYKGIERKYLLLSICSIPFYFLLYYCSSILRGKLLMKGYNISNQLIHFSNICFILIFLAVGELGIIEAIIAGISGIVLGAVYSATNVLRTIKGISFSKELFVRLMKDGSRLYIGSLATFINFQVSFLILNYYANSSEVGFYSVAYSIANILLFFSISLEIGLYPKIVHSTMNEAVELTKVASRQITLITLAGALAVALFSEYIVLVYGGKSFLSSVKPLLLLLPGVVVLVVSKVLNALWLKKGWFSQLTLIAVFGAIMSLVLNFFLIPKFEAGGAAIANTITNLFLSLSGLFLFWKYVDRDLSGLFVPRCRDFMMYRDIFRNPFKRKLK
jgi:O-antigen/teichoic acid export membrane protein